MIFSREYSFLLKLCKYKSNTLFYCVTNNINILDLEFNVSLQCHHYLRKDQLLVYHHHVDQMQSAKNKMEQVLVLVFLNMWEIHMKVVAQSVC
jgi:hypothetical protein